MKAIKAAHVAGDRGGALAAVTDEIVDAIDVVGDHALVATAVNAYRKSGVDVPVVFPLTWGATAGDEIHALESTLHAATEAPPREAIASEV